MLYYSVMNKTGQIKLYAQISAAVFIVCVIALVVCLFVRSSLVSKQMNSFNDPAPLTSSLRGTICDKNGIFLAMDLRKTITSANGGISSVRTRVYPYPEPSIIRLLGETDNEGQGISGIEKLCNEYLVSSEKKDKSMSDGVTLTLDMPIIENIDKTFKGLTGSNIHILAMDTLTGGVSVVWDNDKNKKPDPNDLYSLGDMSESPLINAFLVAIMAEIDKSRLFDYKCIGSSLCPTPHNLITVDNISTCNSAVQEMLKLYNEDEVASYLNSLSFDNYSIASFMNSTGAAIQGKSSPKMHILNSIRVNGEKSEVEVEYTPSPLLSKNIAAFLLSQLGIASNSEKIFKTGKYIVYVRSDEKNINDIIKALKTILS